MISDELIVKKYSVKDIAFKASLIKNLAPLLQGGWVYGFDGKIKQVIDGMQVGAPWVYVRRVEDIKCQRHHGVLFSCYKIIPQYCMNCYKVVIRPRTVVELFKLHETMRYHFPDWIKCKCGTEDRPYVNAQYGGYCYTQGLEEGQKAYEEVRRLVDEHISPDVPIVLKRACTEYKEMYGPAANWDEIKEAQGTKYPRKIWDAIEEWVDEKFVFPESNPSQPDDLAWGVMEHWIEFAYAIGDKSYKLLNDGEDIHPIDSTFHREVE